MKKFYRLVFLALLGLALFGCAASFNDQVNTANSVGIVAGFWRGLWHGLIAPVTFIISLFTQTVQMYEVHNNGNWYDLGFLLGLMIILGGGGAGSARRSMHRR